MMRALGGPAALWAVLLLCSTCSPRNEVALRGTNFEEEIQLTQNLVFTFNRDLVTEADLGTWQTTRFIEFKPEVPGRYRWTGKNELVFSPSTAFRPATDYEAHLTDALLHGLRAEGLRLTGEVRTFHTPYLRLVSAEPFWSRTPAGQPEARLQLDFNYPVSGTEVLQKLRLMAKDRPVSVRGGTAGLTSTLPIALEGSTGAERLRLTLDRGLKVPGTAHQLTEPIEQAVRLPDPKQLEVLDVQAGFENGRGVIRIRTNQQLDARSLAEAYHLEGSAPIEPEPEPSYDSLGNPVAAPPTRRSAGPRPITVTSELLPNGLVLRGDFNETDTYVLTLRPALRGVLGARLREELTRDVYFGRMPANLAFVHRKALYLTPQGRRNVAVEVTNVPRVQVKIARIYENNILNYLRQYRYRDYSYADDGAGTPQGFVYGEDGGLLSDVIVDKVIETQDLPRSGAVALLNLSLPEPAPAAGRGVYLVSLHDRDEYYRNASQLVSLSDIGLVAKQAGEEMLVFAHSIRTTAPLADVEIRLISGNNQLMKTAKTDSRGVARLDGLRETGFSPALVTAGYEADFNYLVLDDARVETSRYAVDGRRDNAAGLDAFVYGDRPLYRPGETVHVNTIVRQSSDWKAVGEVPLQLRFSLPNGRELRRLRVTTNAQGAVATDLPLDAGAVTGTYTLDVLTGSEALLTSYAIGVEEFLPDRLKVDARTTRPRYRPGETVTIDATALNLFGPPAAGRNYELEWQFRRKNFRPAGYEAYQFDRPDATKFETSVRQGQTDAAGKLAEAYRLPPAWQDHGLLEARAFVTVFDETGRPVNRLVRFEVPTQAVFYGVRMNQTYVGTNAPVPIALVALNPDGQPVSAPGQVEIIRHQYQTVIERNGDGSLRYASKKQSESVYRRAVTFTAGRAEVRYAPPTSGEYEVRVSRPGATGGTTLAFYAYGFGQTSGAAFEVSTEGRVEMTFDKERYAPGDRAKVLFKTPFAGKLLVTLERNRVLEYHTLETDEKSAEFSFRVSEEHLPNVYLTATLIRAIDETSTLPLTVAHGFAPLLVDEPRRKLSVEIETAAAYRSKTRQRVTVRTRPGAEVTLAVVDEGILQLKNAPTPDPYGFFYQKRALDVSSHDVYPFLFPELRIKGLSSVGGDGYNLEKRVNPLANGRVKLLSYWSGLRRADGRGEATFEVAIPAFAGDVRLMAVAYDADRFGSAARNVKVADPLVVRAALPRFASPDDQLEVPVTITNTTARPAQLVATLRTTGALQSAEIGRQTLTLAPGGEGQVSFALRAVPAVGTGQVIVTVQGLGETFTETTDLTVRPPTGLVKTATSGVVLGGQAAEVPLDLRGFLPGTARAALLVSRSPLVQLADRLDHLLGYPHGCLEQTVSKAFPQLYFADLVQLLEPARRPYLKTGVSDLNPAANVGAALRKIEALQLDTGGLSAWQAGQREDWWASAYAAHFMVEAQRAGFDVNARTLTRLLEYLHQKTAQPSTETGVVPNTDGSVTNRRQARREALYSLYVLALAGQPNRAVGNFYKANTALLGPDSRYLLAATFGLTGDERSRASLLPGRYAPAGTRRETGGSYSSPIRDQALVLSTLLETDPDHLQVPLLARQLSEAVRRAGWLSTQEEAFALLALGKLARRIGQSTATARISAAGKDLAPFTGTDLLLNKGVGTPLRVAAQGRGGVYYFARAEGIPVGRVAETDQVLQVRRQYLSRDGKPLTGMTFRQNELVVVKLTVRSLTGLPVENVVVTDLLPAGLEIENPRLTGERELAWIKGQATPEHFDLRDDRILYFTDVAGTPKTFYYLARAVSKGRFRLGPASADAMYNGEYRSYSGSGTVVVE
jgi:uncharacterized protein YfaS (alpha-2-macroglobulin family)